MDSQKKAVTRKYSSLNQKYQSQKKIKTVKNLRGIESSNRPSISKIGIRGKDNKVLVNKSTLNNSK